MLKDKINLLFVQDVHISMKGVVPNYYVTPVDDNLWKVDNAPLVYKGSIGEVKDYLCYDFDTLDQNYQNLFEMKKMTLTKAKENDEESHLYKVETKIYKKGHK